MSSSDQNNAELNPEADTSAGSSGGAFKKMKLDNVFFNNNSTSEAFASPKRVVKRRFPGPGGLRPVASENLELQSTKALTHDEDFSLLCSQQTHLLFEHGPWSEMVHDFRFSNSCGELYEKFSISWIKSNSGKGKFLVYQKAPFLAAIIDDLIVTGQAVNVTLKDKSGSIKSVVLHDLYKDYKDNFTVGSVLVLRQFGVIPMQKDPCITITPKNLLRIYHNEILKKDSDNVSVKKIVINDCDINEIWENYNESVRLYPQKLSKQTVSDNVNTPRNSTNTSNTSAQSTTTTLPHLSHNVKIFKRTSTDVAVIKSFDKEGDKNKTVYCDQDPKKEVKDSKMWEDFFEDVDLNSCFDDF